MYLVSLYSGYFLWHYGRAFRDSFAVVRNLLWFIAHFFSIPLLLRTLFAPWKRVTENHARGTGLEDYFATLAVNLMSRLVGAIIRLAVIAFGLATLVAFILLIVVFYVVWVAAPVLFPVAFLYGFLILF